MEWKGKIKNETKKWPVAVTDLSSCGGNGENGENSPIHGLLTKAGAVKTVKNSIGVHRFTRFRSRLVAD
jgi:hypothetical protein